MLKKRLAAPKYIYPAVLLLAVTLVYAIPLLNLPTTRGHDIFFHLQRIDALADEFRLGNYMPRIYSTLLSGCGYASPMFYGDLFLSLPAALVCAGMSVCRAYTVFQVIVIYAAAMCAYFAMRAVTKKDNAALVGAALYVFSSYFSTDLFHRGALGEATAFVFLPVAFLGYYHIMYGERDRWYLLTIGMLGLLASHTLTSVMTALVLTVKTVCFGRQIMKKPQRLGFLALSAVCFLIVGADFLFPMLEQMSSTTFLATDGYAATKWGTLAERVMPLKALFNDTYVSPDGSWWIPRALGPAPLLLAAAWIAFAPRVRDRRGVFYTGLALVLMLVTTELFPWETVQEQVGVIQFPWRILTFGTLFFAVGAALFYAKSAHTRVGSVAMVVVAVFSLASFAACYMPILNTFIRYKNEGVPEYNYTENIGAAEYLPTSDAFTRGSSYSSTYAATLRKNADKIYSDGKLRAAFKREGDVLTVRFEGSSKENAYIDVPLVMYKGYSAVLDDGTELECTYGVYNRVRVYIGSRTDGVITFEYTGTTVQHVSRAVSISGAVLLCAYICFSVYRRRKTGKARVASLERMLDGGEVTERTAEAIGTRDDVALMTCQPPQAAYARMRGMRLPVAAFDGAVCVRDGAVVSFVPLPRETVAELLSRCEGLGGVILYRVGDGRVKSAALRSDVVAVGYAERYLDDTELIDGGLSDLPDSSGETPVAVTIVCSEESARRCFDRVRNVRGTRCRLERLDAGACVVCVSDRTDPERAVRGMLGTAGRHCLECVDCPFIADAEVSAARSDETLSVQGRATVLVPDDGPETAAKFIVGDDTSDTPKSSDTVTNS